MAGVITRLTVSDDSPYVLESPLVLREGESRAFALNWTMFSSVSTGGTEVYVNGSSKSASFLSGTTTASANILTLPTLTVPAGQGGNVVVVEAGAGNGGLTYKIGIVCHIMRPGDEG